MTHGCMQKTASIPDSEKEVDVSELTEQAKQRDSQAFAFLIQREMSVVEAVIRKYIRNIVGYEEEDIVTMVIVYAWEKISDFRDSDVGFKYWITQKAKWLCLDLLAEQKKQGIHISVDDNESVMVPEDPAPNILETMLEVEKEQIFRAALQSLPDEFRKVISLRYEGLSYQEIAGQLRITIGTVGSRLNRGIRMIRDDLAKQGLLE